MDLLLVADVTPFVMAIAMCAATLAAWREIAQTSSRFRARFAASAGASRNTTVSSAINQERAATGANGAEVRVSPGEIECRALAQRRRDLCRQHPGKAGPALARHEGRRLRKGHARLADPGADGAQACADEGPEGGEPRGGRSGQVDPGGQHPRDG